MRTVVAQHLKCATTRINTVYYTPPTSVKGISMRSPQVSATNNAHPSHASLNATLRDQVRSRWAPGSDRRVFEVVGVALALMATTVALVLTYVSLHPPALHPPATKSSSSPSVADAPSTPSQTSPLLRPSRSAARNGSATAAAAAPVATS